MTEKRTPVLENKDLFSTFELIIITGKNHESVYKLSGIRT